MSVLPLIKHRPRDHCSEIVVSCGRLYPQRLIQPALPGLANTTMAKGSNHPSAKISHSNVTLPLAEGCSLEAVLKTKLQQGRLQSALDATVISNKKSEVSIAYYSPSQDDALSLNFFGVCEPALERHGSQTLLQSPHTNVEQLRH